MVYLCVLFFLNKVLYQYWVSLNPPITFIKSKTQDANKNPKNLGKYLYKCEGLHHFLNTKWGGVVMWDFGGSRADYMAKVGPKTLNI